MLCGLSVGFPLSGRGLVVSTFLLLGFAARATPCICAATSLREELKKADAVFVGEAVSFRSSGSGDPMLSSVARIQVSRYWKGTERPEQIDILTDGSNGSDCGPVLAKGTYLVYAYKKGQWLATWACTRTRRIEEAAEDLKMLGPGHPPTKSK